MTSLLKLTEREGFCKPTCKTMQAGSPHMPTFFSTVEIEGVEFHGKGSRSMQQAEEDAAKIAYIALKGCKLIVPLQWCTYPIFLSCMRTTLWKF
uniref:DRBM domain-containing protein n=1 Tax=Cajanus cajan TaxID=3821 RepID=A0A151T1I4_CAJCA|nr:hypothetical protein KK1_023309 [Cajanus cajan]